MPYEGWVEIPNVWFITEKDRMVPVGLQEASAKKAEGRVVRIGSGHAPMLSMPGELAKLVLDNLEDE